MNKFDLIIIGDLAYNLDLTPNGGKKSLGGSAYYCALGASTVSSKVGVVSRVGKDFKIQALKKRGIDVEGIKVINNGQTPLFILCQFSNKKRLFWPELGLANEIDVSIFPQSYFSTKYIHLATSDPVKYLKWFNFLKKRIKETTISADAFEQYVTDDPKDTIDVIKKVDLFFINEEECSVLKKQNGFTIRKPYIFKRGEKGAEFRDGYHNISIKAPKVKPIDTTGAGDVLAGAYLASIAQGKSIKDALTIAVKVASKSVTNFGVEHIKPI